MTEPSRPDRAEFDPHAQGYDDVAQSRLGIELRRRVHDVLEALVDAEHVVVDAGCGTGIDAAWLADRAGRVLAFDPAAGMVAQARARCAGAPNVSVEQGDLASIEPATPVDLLLANFGVVNCVPDMTMLRDTLATIVRPGGHAVLVTMGRLCPTELAVAVATANRSLLARRRGGSTEAAEYGGMHVRYASPTDLAPALAPDFHMTYAESLGSVLPPFEQRSWVEDRPRLLASLASLDRRLGRVGAKLGVGDHHITVFRRSEP